MLVNLIKSCYGEEVSSQTYGATMGLRYIEMEDVVNVTGEQCYVIILWFDLQPSFMCHTRLHIK